MFQISPSKNAVYVVRDGKLYEVPAHNNDAECFAKAVVRNQPTFTLVGQDLCAIETIVFWQNLVKQSNPNSAKIALADTDITRFTEFQDRNFHTCKIPD